jgi:L-cysteine desulfidase
MNLKMPLKTKLENRRRSSRRPNKTSYLAQMNLGMLSDTTKENRCQASWRQKTPYLAEVRLETPLDTTLETNAKRRNAEMWIMVNISNQT